MTSRCTHCGKENPDDPTFCHMCGSRIKGAPPEPAPMTQPQVLETRPGTRCVWCSAEMGVKDISCPVCHRSRQVIQSEIPPPQPEKKSRGLFIAASLFFVTAVADFVSAIVLLNTNGYIADYGLDVTGMLNICAALEVMFGVFAALAAVMCIMKRSLVLAILGGALGMIGGGPYLVGFISGLAGLVFAIRERDEFRE